MLFYRRFTETDNWIEITSTEIGTRQCKTRRTGNMFRPHFKKVHVVFFISSRVATGSGSDLGQNVSN